MKSIAVRELAAQLSLEILAGADKLDRQIVKARAYRPGLEFVGYYDFFPQEHVQILGRKEITYLHSLSEEERNHHIGNIVKYHPPCFVVTAGQEGLKYLTKYCDQEGIPLLRTKLPTVQLLGMLDAYLLKTLAPEISIHGICLNVLGIGVLLRGKSGIGKSETAHTLIKRGSRLVADDIVVLKSLAPKRCLARIMRKQRSF